MKKNLVIFCLFILVIVPFFTGCDSAGQSPAVVEFSQLMASPSKYNGKNVTVDCYVFLGFEVMALCGGLKPSGYAPGHMIPDGKLVWVEGSIPDDVYNRLQQQQSMGPDERFGRMRVTGKFRSGGHYGHLGGYEYEMIPVEMEILSE